MARLDADLVAALDELRADGAWAHVATVSPDGSPHVTPMLLGRTDEHLLLSLTGAHKRRNLRADPRVSISLARTGDLAHVVVWGAAVLRDDAEAQQLYEAMLHAELGPTAAAAMRQPLSPQTTMLAVVEVLRHRVHGMDAPT